MALDEREPWQSGPQPRSHGSGLSINEAADRAQQRYGGELISIQPASQRGQEGWQVKVLLSSGRVKTLFVEARSGTVVDRRERD